MKTLWVLDDERVLEDITWVEYPEHIMGTTIRNGVFFNMMVNNQQYFGNLLISFDHDIQTVDEYGEEVTGYHCLKHLVDRLVELQVDKHNLPDVVFHSMNPVGVENMKSYWNNFVKHLEEL